MTLAYDRTTGALLGQLAALDAQNDHLRGYVRILTRDGYLSLPESSVRLETVR